MKTLRFQTPLALLGVAALALGVAGPANAELDLQCGPYWQNFDANGDAVPDAGSPDNLKCMNVSGSDGFVRMLGRLDDPFYVFGFRDQTGRTIEDAVGAGLLGAQGNHQGEIALDQGDEFYLNLTNVGMIWRPDLFDSHTIHYHGFQEISATMDGSPDHTFAPNQESNATYYYKNVQPGTYAWHCHVEATEHMQMGMLGALWVRPEQNRLPDGTMLGSHMHSNPDWCGAPGSCPDDALNGDTYVYNDTDASTRYDVEYTIQLTSVDPVFHDASRDVQPLPFADMLDTYHLMNGRSYPLTVEDGTGPLAGLLDNTDLFETLGLGDYLVGYDGSDGFDAKAQNQPIDSLIEATQGDLLLLRFINLSSTTPYTMQVMGMKWKVVGRDARILHGGGVATGTDKSYESASYTIAGGETAEVIIDTTDVVAGTYVLQTTNLNLLSNNTEDYGGLMTEIVISN